MRKKIAIAPLVLALALALSACGEEPQLAVMDQTVNVTTAQAARGSLTSECSYIGSITAEGSVHVIPLVSANVESVDVQVGDHVTVGQALCNLDDTAAELNLATAQASVSSATAGIASVQAGILSAQASAAQANAAVSSAQETFNSTVAQYGGEGTDSLPVLEEQVRLAEDNYANTQALLEAGAASQIEVDQAYQQMLSARAGLQAAKAGLQAAQAGVDQAKASLGSTAAGHASAQAGVGQAQAGLQQAQAAVASAEYQLSLYHITSPIDGVVEAVNVTENNFSAQGTAAFTISRGEGKSVTFYVTDQVRKQMQQGQAVTVHVGEKDYSGSVTEIAGVVDAQTGLFKIKALVEDAADLPDGLSVQLQTTAYAADDALLIPSDALYFEDGETYVFLAQDGKAVRTPVTVALYTEDTVAVTAGLSEGDAVIDSWSAALRNGATIQVAGGAENG